MLNFKSLSRIVMGGSDFKEESKEVGLIIEKVVLINERMFYDSTWDIYTNQGVTRLKMYDDTSEKSLLSKCEKCNTIEELLNLQPKHFYYD